MSAFSLYPSADNNFTNSSLSYTMSDMISNDWKRFAQQFLVEGNSTAAIDSFCNVWVGDNTSVGEDMDPHATIWNHAMTKTIGWTMVMLVKSIFFERRFDSWSGVYRFLNLGSTLIPFAMATWTIYNAMGEVGEGRDNKNEEPISVTASMLILGKHVVNTPMARRWALTGLTWALFQRLMSWRIRSSKTFTGIELIPGILAGILSLACWIVDETTIAAIVTGGELQPNTLLVYATLMKWMANAVTGWYCYAGIIKGVFGTNRFTSFPWFLLAVFAGKIASSGHAF